MNIIKLYLKTSGAVADIEKDFNLYQGQYKNVLIDIYVPQSILTEGSIVDIGYTRISRAGAVETSDEYWSPLFKENVDVNGIKYNVYSTKMPADFTKYAGTGANAMTMVVNVRDVNGNDIDRIITSQQVKMDVMPSTRLVEPNIPATELDKIKAILQAKQDKNVPDLGVGDNTIEGAIKYLDDLINNPDNGLDKEVKGILAKIRDVIEPTLDTHDKAISKNAQDISDLADVSISGRNWVGQIEKDYLPEFPYSSETTTLLNNFVQEKLGRQPKDGDYLDWKYIIGGTFRVYTIAYTTKWNKPDLKAPIEKASNERYGIIKGGITANKQLNIDIVAGTIHNIGVLIASGEYKALSIYLNEVNAMIEDIVDGTTPVAKATHSTTSDTSSLADKSVKAENDGLGRNIVETYAGKNDVYTKDESNDRFLPNTYNKIYYYTNEGIVDNVPTLDTPQFSVTTSKIGSTELFTENRVLLGDYKFNKNSADDSVFWLTANRNCKLSFRLTTTGIVGIERTTLAVDTSEVVSFTANVPRLVNIKSLYNQLGEHEIKLVTGNIIEKKLEIVTDFSTATKVDMYCNETYPSTFILASQSITLQINEITGKKVYDISENKWQDNGEGEYFIDITAKQLDIAPSTQYGMDMQYWNGYGWQRVAFTPIIRDDGSIKITSAKPLEAKLLVWIATDLDAINEGGTRVSIGGKFVQTMDIPKPIEDMIKGKVNTQSVVVNEEIPEIVDLKSFYQYFYDKRKGDDREFQFTVGKGWASDGKATHENLIEALGGYPFEDMNRDDYKSLMACRIPSNEAGDFRIEITLRSKVSNHLFKGTVGGIITNYINFYGWNAENDLPIELGSVKDGVEFDIDPTKVADMFLIQDKTIHLKWSNYDVTLIRFDRSTNDVFYSAYMLLNGMKYTYTLRVDKTTNKGILTRLEEPVVVGAVSSPADEGTSKKVGQVRDNNGTFEYANADAPTEWHMAGSIITKDNQQLSIWNADEIDGLVKSITLEKNTGILTITSFDGNTKTIDLPTEFIIKDGSYDNTTHIITFILENGQKLEIPIGDLISGLATKSYVDTELGKKANVSTGYRDSVDLDTLVPQANISKTAYSINNFLYAPKNAPTKAEKAGQISFGYAENMHGQIYWGQTSGFCLRSRVDNTYKGWEKILTDKTGMQIDLLFSGQTKDYVIDKLWDYDHIIAIVSYGGWDITCIVRVSKTTSYISGTTAKLYHNGIACATIRCRGNEKRVQLEKAGLYEDNTFKYTSQLENPNIHIASIYGIKGVIDKS